MDSIPTISEDLHSVFDRCLRSDIITLVSKGGVKFYVHQEILAFHSDPFADAISGEWIEATKKEIQLQDWGAETVGRMIQFMYTGDYRYPEAYETPPEASPSLKTEEHVPTAVQPRRGGTLTPFAEFVKRAVNDSRTPCMTDGSWLDSVDISTFDFQETMLAHANVYALAHYKSIAALKDLAHGRIAKLLMKLDPMGPNPHLQLNIIDLATNIYSNTDSLSNCQEPLREMISQYVALNFVTWQTAPAALEMMCRGGDFVRDVLQKLSQRLSGRTLPALASPGTRFISRFRVVTQDTQPDKYVRKLDSATGEEIVERGKWVPHLKYISSNS